MGIKTGRRFVPDGTLCPPHGWRQWPTPSDSAEQDDPSVQRGECAMDRGRRSTAQAYQDLDDRSRQARRGAEAETEDCNG